MTLKLVGVFVWSKDSLGQGDCSVATQAEQVRGENRDKETAQDSRSKILMAEKD